MTDDVVKDELHSAIQTRKELGDEMEPAVIDAFVARIERGLADRADESERALQRKRNHQQEMVLGSRSQCSRSPLSSPACPASSLSAPLLS